MALDGSKRDTMIKVAIFQRCWATFPPLWKRVHFDSQVLKKNGDDFISVALFFQFWMDVRPIPQWAKRARGWICHSAIVCNGSWRMTCLFLLEQLLNYVVEMPGESLNGETNFSEKTQVFANSHSKFGGLFQGLKVLRFQLFSMLTMTSTGEGGRDWEVGVGLQEFCGRLAEAIQWSQRKER